MTRSRQRNSGLRKRCGCSRKVWSKCQHGWHINFKQPGGPHYRISLDRELGRHVGTKTEATAEAEQRGLPIEVDAVNEAVRVLSAAIPPDAAVELARIAAEAVDRELEGLSPELEKAIEAANRPRVLRRSEHRREHLDQIERALAR